MSVILFRMHSLRPTIYGSFINLWFENNVLHSDHAKKSLLRDSLSFSLASALIQLLPQTIKINFTIIVCVCFALRMTSAKI
jgi:hypothetical protein